MKIPHAGYLLQEIWLKHLVTEESLLYGVKYPICAFYISQ